MEQSSRFCRTAANGRSHRAKIDATTEAEIATQIAEDEAEAMRDAALHARRHAGTIRRE
jgi:hypothetical protein